MRHDLLRKYLTNPRDFDGWLKKCLRWFDRGCRHPDDGVGCPIFGGGSNQIELSSVGRVSKAIRTDQAPCARKPFHNRRDGCGLLND
jgi:hypothetical protein